MGSGTMSYSNEEHQEQKFLFEWWAIMCQRYKIPSELLFAIPNGGKRNIITAKLLKDEGVKAGVPDVFLAVPRKDFNGLFIEMKKKKGGVVSENQTKMLELLKRFGYKAVVCNGAEAAVKEIVSYLM